MSRCYSTVFFLDFLIKAIERRQDLYSYYQGLSWQLRTERSATEISHEAKITVAQQHCQRRRSFTRRHTTAPFTQLSVLTAHSSTSRVQRSALQEKELLMLMQLPLLLVQG